MRNSQDRKKLFLSIHLMYQQNVKCSCWKPMKNWGRSTEPKPKKCSTVPKIDDFFGSVVLRHCWTPLWVVKRCLSTTVPKYNRAAEQQCRSTTEPKYNSAEVQQCRNLVNYWHPLQKGAIRYRYKIRISLQLFSGATIFKYRGQFITRYHREGNHWSYKPFQKQSNTQPADFPGN